MPETQRALPTTQPAGAVVAALAREPVFREGARALESDLCRLIGVIPGRRSEKD